MRKVGERDGARTENVHYVTYTKNRTYMEECGASTSRGKGCHRGRPAQRVTTGDRDRPRCRRDSTIKLVSPLTRSTASFFVPLHGSSFVPTIHPRVACPSASSDTQPIVGPTYAPRSTFTTFLSYRLPTGWVLETFITRSKEL